MIGKKKINQIKGLAQKKNRLKEQLFLIEGDKVILEVVKSDINIKELYATSDFLRKHETLLIHTEKIIEVSHSDIKKASLLMHPQQSLAVCYLPLEKQLPEVFPGNSFYLDGIQDPGNLGTIIRTADWFGMENLFCSPDTVDLYNPKVIQSSMGSFCRINTFYLPFKELASLPSFINIHIYGTFLEGDNLFTTQLSNNSLIVLGNEGSGIRKEAESRITKKLHIPSFKKSGQPPESLNVSVAAGILAGEFQRQRSDSTFTQNESSG